MPEYRDIHNGAMTVRLLRNGDIPAAGLTLAIRRWDTTGWEEYDLQPEEAREIASAMLLLLGCAVMIEDMEDGEDDN